MVTRVQYLDEAVWISYSINVLDKGMNPTDFPATMGK